MDFRSFKGTVANSSKFIRFKAKVSGIAFFSCLRASDEKAKPAQPSLEATEEALAARYRQYARAPVSRRLDWGDQPYARLDCSREKPALRARTGPPGPCACSKSRQSSGAHRQGPAAPGATFDGNKPVSGCGRGVRMAAANARQHRLAVPEAKRDTVAEPSARPQEFARRNSRDLRPAPSRWIRLNAEAYRLLAEMERDPDRARLPMQEAVKRSRRESVAVFWLLNDSFLSPGL